MKSFSGCQTNEQDADHFEEPECLHYYEEKYLSAKDFSMNWIGMYFFNSREITGNSQIIAQKVFLSETLGISRLF